MGYLHQLHLIKTAPVLMSDPVEHYYPIRLNINRYSTQEMAVHAAVIMQRMTGDRCRVKYTDRGVYRIVRIDPTGVEARLR